MKAEKVSAPRLMIYRLLVDGLGPGAGMSASSVHKTLTARGMTISRAGVYQHVNALKKSGYIREIRGTKSPVLYERGRNAPVLDDPVAATCQPLDNSSNGGGSDCTKIVVKGIKIPLTPLKPRPTSPPQRRTSTGVTSSLSSRSESYTSRSASATPTPVRSPSAWYGTPSHDSSEA